MPGVRDEPADPDWFEATFGFKEKSYEKTKEMFELSGDRTSITSKGNSSSFHIGTFEVVSLGALIDQYREVTTDTSEGSAASAFMRAGDLVFENIVAKTADLYADAENAGAVFQVCSLFNCLETYKGWGRPEDGISMYAKTALQGPVSAIACPAATVLRNYFIDEVDCLAEAAKLVDNAENRYWTVRNGYCMPYCRGGIAKLSHKIANEPSFATDVKKAVQIGIHWDTQTWSGSHHVCQAFCSALPVALCKTTASSSEWEGFGRAVLEAEFDATLTAAATLAAKRGTRVKVFLTPLGAGVLGNRRNWIVEELDNVLTNHRKEPLDVFLVHYAELPTDGFQDLEEGRCTTTKAFTATLTPQRRMTKTVTMATAHLMQTLPDVADDLPAALHFAEEGVVHRLTRMFATYDANGDGYIHVREFKDMLYHADPHVFTASVIDALVDTADADDSGVIHYAEFLSWVFDEDAATESMIAASMHPFSPTRSKQ